jgi:hypothetical protein
MPVPACACVHASTTTGWTQHNNRTVCQFHQGSRGHRRHQVGHDDCAPEGEGCVWHHAAHGRPVPDMQVPVIWPSDRQALLRCMGCHCPVSWGPCSSTPCGCAHASQHGGPWAADAGAIMPRALHEPVMHQPAIAEQMPVHCTGEIFERRSSVSCQLQLPDHARKVVSVGGAASASDSHAVGLPLVTHGHHVSSGRQTTAFAPCFERES